MTFSAGSVLGRAIGVTGKNFLTFFLIALIVMGPVVALQRLIGVGEPVSSVAGEPKSSRSGRGEAKSADERPDVKKELAGMVLNFVGQSILGGAFAFGVFQSLRGGRAGVGECLSRAFGRVVPIFGVSLVYGVAVGLGSLLLLVPGIMIACAWYLSVPITTVERLGVGASLRRSGELTRGYRWSIFGMFLLVTLLGVVITLVLAGVLTALGPIIALLGMGIVAVFVALYAGTLSAVCYHDLRLVKEGASTEELLRVFG
jgi:hypothetical protein